MCIRDRYFFEYFDAAGTVDYLNSATKSAVESTAGYGGTANKKKD